MSARGAELMEFLDDDVFNRCPCMHAKPIPKRHTSIYPLANRLIFKGDQGKRWGEMIQ